MKHTDLSPLESLPYFTIEAVKQLGEDKDTAPGTIRTALYRWMKARHVVQLKKGVYTTRRFYELHRSDENFSMAISAILIPQSYVSLEYILQRNAILTEITYPVSAITSKNTRVIENALGTFSYRHIKNELFTGYSISNYFGVLFSQASVAKALFDYLYLRPNIGKLASPSHNLAEDLRLNLEEFSASKQEEFATYVETSKSPKMLRILGNLRRTVWHH
jgi:hypothetical protein